MKTKTAYRPKNIPTEEPSNIPEEPPQPSESVRVEFTDKTEPAVAVVSQDQYPEPNEAAEALKRQLEHLRTSEELQRRHAERMAQQQQQPPTHQQLLQAWRSQGADEGDLAFLESNPSLMDNPRLCRLASDEAAEHHQRGTEAHRQATKEIFDGRLGHQQAQPVGSVEPTPAFFEPPEPSRSPAVPDRGSIYSAPVSRRDAGAPREPQHPRQVKLSPIEQEIARNLGLSDVAYAEGKLAMQRRKASGELQ